MAVVGTLGRNIVFEVRDDKALLLQSMSRDISSRWTTHTTCLLYTSPSPRDAQ